MIGALILTIPMPVMGGLSLVVFGLIAAAAGRIWVENRVDFTNPRNLLTVGVAVMIAAGNLSLKLGNFVLSGIGLATASGLILYHGLGLRREIRQQSEVVAEEKRGEGLVVASRLACLPGRQQKSGEPPIDLVE